MIETIATIDILNLAIDQLDEGRTMDCKDTLITYRDKLQKEVDELISGQKNNQILILLFN